MTEHILQRDEFIIKLDVTPEEMLIEGKPAKIMIINPHKSGYDSTALRILQELIKTMAK